MSQPTIPQIPENLSTQENHIWRIKNWYYPWFFDKAYIQLGSILFSEDAQNMRHKIDPGWPKGPDAVIRSIKQINGKCGGGLDHLETEVLKIWTEGDGKVYTITLQHGIRNHNETENPAIRDLPPGSYFMEVQLHCYDFDPETHLIYLHNVEFWTTPANGKFLRDVA